VAPPRQTQHVASAQVLAQQFGEDAGTTWKYSANPRFQFIYLDEHKEASGCQMKLQITKVRVQVSLELDVGLPPDATPALIKHERAHERICQRLYKDSTGILEDAAKSIVGATFQGSGKDSQSAQTAAINKASPLITNKYIEHVNDAASKISANFDRITEHGLKTVDEEAAINQAFSEYEKSTAGSAQPGSAVTPAPAQDSAKH
jgi:hypothetical protein